MIQHKKYVQKGKHYLTKGLTHCKDEFLKIKFNEALFIYSVLYTDRKNTEKGIHNISQSKYIDFFSMMLEDNYESNLNYQRQLMELKNTSSLFRFLFIENCKFQRKYKDICVTNNWV